MIGKVVRYKLGNNSGITALVSSRIYPNYIPETAAMPAMAYELRNLSINLNQAGQIREVASIDVVISVEAQGAGCYESAWTIAQAVIACLQNGEGVWGTGGNTKTIRDCQLAPDGTSESTLIDAESDDYVFTGIELTFNVKFNY